MELEAKQLEEKLKRHEERAKQEWQSIYAEQQRDDDMRLQSLTAANDQELEQARLQQYRLEEELNAKRRDVVQLRQQHALSEQSINPLGLYASTSSSSSAFEPPPYNPAHVPSAPEEASGQAPHPLPSYAAAKDDKAKSSSELFERKSASDQPPQFYVSQSEQRRCGSCFDVIAQDLARGRSGQAVQVGGRIFHLECYEKKAAPTCAHCGRTLSSHPEDGLSGAWGVYKQRSYHVECYQYYAGPRCSSCFNVIFANPELNLSGEWRSLVDGTLIHEECFQRRSAHSSVSDASAAPSYESGGGDKTWR